MKYMILDEDKDSQLMLNRLIKQNDSDHAVMQLEKGENFIDDIMFYCPDILLIDPVTRKEDWFEQLREIIDKGYKGKIIIVSAIREKDMISQAYDLGALFCINKPINTAEIVSILKNTKKLIELEKSLTEIRQILVCDQSKYQKEENRDVDFDDKLYEIFSEIGIVGLSGTEEIYEVLKYIYHIQKTDRKRMYYLKDVYREVSRTLYKEKNRQIVQKNMEQRIRRTIQKALMNIAEIGCEDYYDPIFTKYSNILFDFKQVRQEMQHIKDPKSYAGKINTKKFMEGILSKVD